MKQVLVWVNPSILTPSKFVANLEQHGFTVDYLEKFTLQILRNWDKSGYLKPYPTDVR